MSTYTRRDPPAAGRFLESFGCTHGRGEKTEAFYVGMVTLLSTRRSVYQHSIHNSLRGSVGTSQGLASIGAETMASTRHLFRQSRADIAAILGGGTSKGKSKDALAAMDRYEDSFDEENQ